MFNVLLCGTFCAFWLCRRPDDEDGADCFTFSSWWASMRESLPSSNARQQMCLPACASAQADQRLCVSCFGIIIFKLATSINSFF